MKSIVTIHPVRSLALLAFLAACAALSISAAAQTGPHVCTIPLPAPTSTPATISINSQHQWVLNGNTWIPRGVGIKAFIASTAYLQGQTAADGVAEYTAQSAYGTNEMLAIKAYGADTIRYQVSQYSLSHDANGNPSATGDLAFVNCLKTAVALPATTTSSSSLPCNRKMMAS